MKKSDFATLLVYALMFVIAIFVGMMVIGPALDNLELNSTTSRYAYAIISILLGLIFNIVWFELGHVIGAKLGGYRIRSVNILGICLYKQNAKWRLTVRAFDGLTGETKVVAKNDKASPLKLAWFPLILFTIEVTALILAYSLIPEPTVTTITAASYIKYSSLIFISIGGMIMLYDIMPFPMDTMNDGYRLVLMAKPINVQAFNVLTVIEEHNEDATPLELIQPFDEVTIMTGQVNLVAAYQKLYQGQISEVELLINQLVENKQQLNVEIAGRASAQKLFLELQKGNLTAAEDYFMNAMDKEERKFVGNDLTLPTLRAYFLYSGLVSKSVSECAFVLSRLDKARKKEPNKALLNEEEALFKAVVEQVKVANPSWEFGIGV